MSNKSRTIEHLTEAVNQQADNIGALLDVINTLLERLPVHQRPCPRLVVTKATVKPKPQERAMNRYQINTKQILELVIDPATGDGVDKEILIDGNLTSGAVIGDEFVSVLQSPSGRVVHVYPTKPGLSQIRTEGDADMGAGVKPVYVDFEVEVLPLEATVLVVREAGVRILPKPKVPVAPEDEVPEADPVEDSTGPASEGPVTNP